MSYQERCHMQLYKYRSAATWDNPNCNTARIFRDGKLYYARPTTLNDPYEAHIEFDMSSCAEKAKVSHLRVLRERNRLNGNYMETLHQTWEQVKRNVEVQMNHIKNGTMDFHSYYRDVMDHHGVLSLSEERNNLLLWAHYGAEHRGICLGLDWPNTGLPEAVEVSYHTMYREVDIWAHTEQELARLACFQKSAEWSYEREWRSFSTAEYERYSNLDLTPEAAEKLRIAEGSGDTWTAKHIREQHTFGYVRPTVFGHRAREFKKESLTEVIFGARMELSDIALHKTEILGLGYVPTFYRVVRNKKRYALDLEFA